MMLNFLKYFKSSPKLSAWHFTKDTTFIGAKNMNIVCYLNKEHILLSSNDNFPVATPTEISKEHWNKLLSAFDDKTSAMQTKLVVLTELNETCDKVFNELMLEARTAGLHNIMD